MKSKILLILIIILLFPSIVNAGKTKDLNASEGRNDSQIPQDYIFFDGDGVVYNTALVTVTKGDNLEDHGYACNSAPCFNYSNDMIVAGADAKVGNMSIDVQHPSALSFSTYTFSPSDLKNVTIQYTFFDDCGDTTYRIWAQLLQADGGGHISLGVDTNARSDNYNDGVADTDSLFKRTCGGLNFTLHFNSEGGSVNRLITYINNTEVFNNSFTEGFAKMRFVSNLGSNKGVFGKIMIWNGSPNDRPQDEPSPPPGSGLPTFKITGIDFYNSSSLKNISVIITNTSSDFSFNASTVNGTIFITNVSVPKFDRFYSLKFRVNDSGGYFNRSFNDINITSGGTFEGSIFQSVLNVIAIDGLSNLSIQDFTVKTNLSSQQSFNGLALILIKKGSFQLNISALGFDDISANFSIKVLANDSKNVTLGSIFTFNLIRESTNTVFDFNSTNLTTLNIFCPNDTIVIFFNTSANISQIVNCEFTLMQIVVDYGILGSYFRTLITPFQQKNVTFYLIDLVAGDIAIQKIIKLLDLTGDFAGSIMTVQRPIAGFTKTIIDQRFDFASQVNLFLLKDALYTLSIDNGLENIILGNLIPTEATEQTITLPKIDFVPTESTLGNQISWAYTFNITANILRMQYKDTTNQTTLVRFTVFNDTPTGPKQLFQGVSQNNASVTITFNQAFANVTYLTELFVLNNAIGNFTDKKIFYQFRSSGAIDFEGFTADEQERFKRWFTWIFLGFWGLLFSRRYTGIGMTSLVIWLWLFRKWAWVEVSGLIFGFVVLLAVVGWITDAMRRN